MRARVAGTRVVLAAAMALLAVTGARAQDGAAKVTPTGHLVWVMPFQNGSAAPGLDWIGASFPDTINQRLSSAGFLTLRREDTEYALQHLGLPTDFHPTRATTYRIAQTLDADYVVFGRYTVTNGEITATARLLRVNDPRLRPEVAEQGKLDDLIGIENRLAWKVAVQIDPGLDLDEQTFVAADRNLRLDSFENYIRGQVEPGIEERIGHLNKAVQLSPNYTRAWFALGKAYFQNQQYEESEVPFSKVPRGSRLSLEALFYAGLGHLYTGHYASAQREFAAISAVLPMPEVLNNEGIAINRQGQNGTALFERVVQLDPQNADSWFNLAVSERREKDYGAALKAVERSLALRPQDAEAQRLKKNIEMLRDGLIAAPVAKAATKEAAAKAGAMKAPGMARAGASQPTKTDAADADGEESSPADSAADAQAGDESAEQDYEPLERIARSYDESSFRQAAFEMEQMNAMKLRSMPAAKQAQVLCQQGTAYINDGLLLEAERQFQMAANADPASADAYAGLAQVHEYAGSMAVARQEAEKSLSMRPNVAAYLVLARMALSQHDFATAEQNVAQALALDTKNSAAKGIEQAIEAQKAAQKAAQPDAHPAASGTP